MRINPSDLPTLLPTLGLGTLNLRHHTDQNVFNLATWVQKTVSF
jgi:hypothetical protein